MLLFQLSSFSHFFYHYLFGMHYGWTKFLQTQFFIYECFFPGYNTTPKLICQQVTCYYCIVLITCFLCGWHVISFAARKWKGLHPKKKEKKKVNKKIMHNHTVSGFTSYSLFGLKSRLDALIRMGLIDNNKKMKDYIWHFWYQISFFYNTNKLDYLYLWVS